MPVIHSNICIYTHKSKGSYIFRYSVLPINEKWRVHVFETVRRRNFFQLEEWDTYTHALSTRTVYVCVCFCVCVCVCGHYATIISRGMKYCDSLFWWNELANFNHRRNRFSTDMALFAWVSLYASPPPSRTILLFWTCHQIITLYILFLYKAK